MTSDRFHALWSAAMNCELRIPADTRSDVAAGLRKFGMVTESGEISVTGFRALSRFAISRQRKDPDFDLVR
ncbi:hypothetical protein ABT324_11585 [Saccharopolyspora sp. NPDC000359]|uniref:hypothetical protein n=1 Tax=Saccharopolyspora sp. NPDC000359 TaxID=3154251 RepID=UPI003331F80D